MKAPWNRPKYATKYAWVPVRLRTGELVWLTWVRRTK